MGKKENPEIIISEIFTFFELILWIIALYSIINLITFIILCQFNSSQTGGQYGALHNAEVWPACFLDLTTVDFFLQLYETPMTELDHWRGQRNSKKGYKK